MNEKQFSGLSLRVKDSAVLRVETTKNDRTQSNINDRVRRLHFHAEILGEDGSVIPLPGVIVTREYDVEVNSLSDITLLAGRECLADGTLSRLEIQWPDGDSLPPVLLTTALLLDATRIYKMKNGILVFDDRKD